MSTKLKRMFGATQVQPAFQPSRRVRMTPQPDPAKRDGPGLRVAHKEEKRRSSQASDNAPPLFVVHEEIAYMVNRDEDDCGGFQPVGVIDWLSYGRWTRDVVHLCAYP